MQVTLPSPAPKSKPQGLAAAVAAGLPAAAPEAAADEYVDMLKAVPQLAALGPIFKTSRAVQVGLQGRLKAAAPLLLLRLAV